jgi:hypothetical protein
MISKIISRAACLRELASNPKSFFNCPDLHGGVPDLPGVARLGFDRIDARQQPDSESFGEPNLALEGRIRALNPALRTATLDF